MRDYFMKTEHIGFSIWREDDFTLAQLLWGDKQVTKFISAAGKLSEYDIRNRLKNEIQNYCEYGVQYWPIFNINTDDFIGCCGLRPYKSENDVYEIGFHLRAAYWGKGLGTEAAQAVINYSFDTLKASDLFAGHHPNNIGSAKTLSKLGFHYTHDELYAPTGLNHPSYRYKTFHNLINY